MSWEGWMSGGKESGGGAEVTMILKILEQSNTKVQKHVYFIICISLDLK